MTCSLKEIALEAGVSEMSVSRALRNQAGISDASRIRILAIAERLGYRPDPRVSQLMSHLRETREKKTSETLAFIWSDGTPESVAQSSYSQELVHAATRRAGEMGFRLDQFWLCEKNLTAKRLSEILNSRGIQALILSPVVQRTYAHASLDWERFTTVTVGLGLRQPHFHRVHHHHYQSMLLALRELRKLGYQRIGFTVHPVLSKRMDHAWRAAFLADHPLPLAEAANLLWVRVNDDAAAQQAWLESARPDVVLGEVAAPDMLPAALPDHIAYATLNWTDNFPNIQGINQCTSALAAAAVDTVTMLFWRNERGIPLQPRSILVEGQWRRGDGTC